MNWRRASIWGGVAAATAFALVAGLRPQPVLVELAKVERGPLQVTIKEEGETRVRDRYVVSAPVAGFIRRIRLDVGDQVEHDVVMTELEPLRSDVLDPRRRAEAEARVAASRAALQAAVEKVVASRADAEHARGEYERKQQLKKASSASDEALALARTEQRRADAVLRSAKFASDVAKYELDAAKTLLEHSAAQPSDADALHERVAIRSPVDGSVLKIHRKSEGVVAAGEALIELGDSHALEIGVDVLSFDAVRIEPGMSVLLERWGGAPLSATVRMVEPVGFTKTSALGVEEQRVWVILDITSPRNEWPSLGDGYRVEARFLLWQDREVLQVPEASLFRADDDWAVFGVDGGVAELRRVQVGRRNGLRAQILDGLVEGDRVVTHPDSSLVDGSRVRVR